MSEHTPGPWRIYECGTIGSASVRIPGTTDVTLPGTIKGATISEAMSNARLIAAAPELLEACKEVLPWLAGLIEGRSDETDAMVDRLRAAIAKAEDK